MAKQQTFADKVKKKKQEDKINVKVIKGVKTAKGSVSFKEKTVKIKDMSEISKIDIN